MPNKKLTVIGGAIALAAVVIIGVAAAGGPSAETPGRVAGPVAPDLPFERFDGSTATLADYRGRPVVVNFWASWCPSCVAEMSAAFLPVQQSLGAEVDFLGLNLQDDRRRAIDLAEETGVLFDLAEDLRGDLYSALGGLGMPFTVFVDEFGTVKHQHNGPVTERQLADLITEHLLS